MNKKKITKEDFLKVLQHIFPLGCAGDTENWQRTWFIGWLGRWSGHAVVEMNFDGDTIVFWLVYYDQGEVSPDTATGYIKAVMEIVMPDMCCGKMFGDDDENISYEFKDE